MIIGQTIFPNSSGNCYYTPWFPRQGDAGECAIQVVDHYDSGGATAWQLTAQIQTKNSEDVDPTPTNGLIGTAITVDAPSAGDTFAESFSGAKELVRVQFKLAGESEDWAVVRALNVSWATN